MKKVKYIFLLFALTSQIACSAKLTSDLQFVYSVDKEGVFLHSLNDNSVKSIYSTNRVFINDYFKFINDTILQVGHQSMMITQKKQRKVYSKYFYRADGDSTFVTDNPPYTVEDNYDYISDSIYYINIKTAESFLAQIKNYEHFDHKILQIKTSNFDQNGKLISEKDTSFNCSATSSSSKGFRFCDFRRYYDESETFLGKTIISERGDLILKKGNSKKLLLKFDGHFDPKFGSGFYNPTLSSDGKKVAFQYLAGFLNSGSCIYEMDIKTKSKEKLIGEDFFDPLYSPDNKLLLLFSNNKQSNNNTWINDIYVFDIASKTKSKLGQGENYLWVPVN